MSKPSIKFIYSGEIRSQVQQLQKGPPRLQNFPGSFMSAPYEQAPRDSRTMQSNFVPSPAISTMEVNSKTDIQTLNRHRSTDNLRPLPRGKDQFEPNALVLNIEDTQESEMKLVGQQRSAGDQKRDSKAQGSEQIVLKAPSYKYTPKREGELAVHSKRQYKKTFSVDKPLNSDTVLRSKKPPKKQEQQKEAQLRSSNPIMQVETIKESEFNVEAKAPPRPPKKPTNFDGQQIVLKAPKYKYTPRAQGQLAVHGRKEYVRAQNTEKYLYEGVKTHRQNDFISCFGCASPVGKTYRNEED